MEYGRTMAQIMDDMDQIHALHQAHGDSKHCNYCDCECGLCKKEGWKNRPEPYEAEILKFQIGERLRIVDSTEIGKVGDEVVYMGNKVFKMLSGRSEGALITFFANSPCAKYFHSVP